MLDIETIRLIDAISIEVRKVFDLPTTRSDADEFNQVNYDQLSDLIQQSFEEITIINNYHSDRSYVLKKKSLTDKKDIFEISVGLDMTSQKRIDCLMHELAHVLMHSDDMAYDTPRWKNSEPWEQEDEANCFSRSFLMPKDYFMFALIKFSRNDGTVDIEKIASYFGVQERLIIERGRDLFVWN